jgi:hypothetical protein
MAAVLAGVNDVAAGVLRVVVLLVADGASARATIAQRHTNLKEAR